MIYGVYLGKLSMEFSTCFFGGTITLKRKDQADGLDQRGTVGMDHYGWFLFIVNDGDRNQCETMVSMITIALFCLLFRFFFGNLISMIWWYPPWIGNQSIDSHHWFAMYPPVHGKTSRWHHEVVCPVRSFGSSCCGPWWQARNFPCGCRKWLLKKKT